MYNHSTKTLAATILLVGFVALLIANSNAVNFLAKKTGKALDEIIKADKPSKGQRIINGKSIDISEAPYYVQISDQHRSLFCGGTVVAEDLVVTAAHCLKTNNILMQHIRVTANTNKRNDKGMTRKVIGIKIHPKYDPETLNADVAVLKVNNGFFLKRKDVFRAGLCKEAPKDDNDITVVGWGSMGKEGTAPTSLQSITVKALSYESCASVMNITKTMMCSKVTDNKDACQGDSGGPAIYQGRLCGVVSWGVGCGVNGMPGVYTSIVKVRGFINSILNNTVTFD